MNVSHTFSVSLRCAVVVGCVLVGSAESALGESVQLSASRDNTLFASNDGSRSNGAGELLIVGRNSQTNLSQRRAVIHFDIAGQIPPGSTIQSAELVIHVLQNSSGLLNFELHRLVSDWGEGSSDAGVPSGQGAPSAPDDATWLHRFYDAALWATAGGDFEAAATASAQINGVGALTWVSSPPLLQDVQDGLDNPVSNFGWIIIGDESQAGSAVRIGSRQHSDPAMRPQLHLTFAPPPEAIPAVSTWGLVILALSIASVARTIGLARRGRGTRGLAA